MQVLGWRLISRWVCLVLPWVCLVSGVQAQAVQPVCPRLIRVGVMETFTPPFLSPPAVAGDPPVGLFAEWVHAGAERTRCKPLVKLRSLPRKRAFWELEHGDLDFFLPTVPTIASLGQFAFPMKNGRADGGRAFKITDASLWVRRDETAIQWDGRVLKGPPGLEIGVAAGSPSEVLARQRGWKVAAGKSPSNSVDRLVHGRVRVALVADIVVSAYPPDVVAGLKRLTPPLARYEYQAAGSKAFVEHYPQFANEFWQGLCQAGRAHAQHKERADKALLASCQ